MDTDSPPPRCTATSKRSGERCKRRPIPGGAVCSVHGGKAPAVQAAARRRLEEQAARRAVAVLGLGVEDEIETNPHQALLDEVNRAARWVAGYEMVIADLERQSLVNGVTKTVQLPDGSRRIEAQAAVNVWMKLYGEERDRLVRACRAAIEAGVSERLVRLEEDKGRLIAELIQRVIDDPELGLDDEVRSGLRVAAARELRALSGAAA